MHGHPTQNRACNVQATTLEDKGTDEAYLVLRYLLDKKKLQFKRLCRTNFTRTLDRKMISKKHSSMHEILVVNTALHEILVVNTGSTELN